MAEPIIASTSGTTTRSTTTGDPTVRPGSELKPASSGQQTAPQQSRISVIDRVKQSATEQFSTQKDRGIDALGSVTQAVRSSSQRLRDEKHETIAGYVDQAVDQVESWSRRIKEKDLEQLATDVQRLARRQPAVFIGSAFALGLIGARFLKSSRPQNSFGDQESQRARYGGRTERSAAYDQSASGSKAKAEVALRAHEVAVSDGSPAGPRSPIATSDGAGRSSRGRKSGPSTEKS